MAESAQTFCLQNMDDSLKEAERSAQTKLEDSSISFKKRTVVTSCGVSRSRSGRRPQTQLSNSFYQEIRDKMKALEMPLWNASATTWVRDSSPQHRIPTAQRFSTLDQDRRRNSQFLNLRLYTNMVDQKRGRTFEKAKRKDHFVDKNKEDNPSPANYRTRRFLDNSSYKTRNISPLAEDYRPNSQRKINELPSSTSYSFIGNPEEKTVGSPHYQNFNHLTKQDEEFRFDELKGRTIFKTRNHHKLYLQHGKQFPYNEHFSKNNPGVGKYQVNDPIGRNRVSYSMRKVLNRFNQNIKASPGPADYITNAKEAKPSTQKNTITFSNRLDLSKPLNQTPGPAHYRIGRYPQKKKQL